MNAWMDGLMTDERINMHCYKIYDTVIKIYDKSS